MRENKPNVLEVSRPWGGFRQYCQNEPATVKIITVEAGAELSLQAHRQRSELWVALDSGLQVEVDGRVWVPAVGETIWIPVGARHRLGTTRRARVLEVSFGQFDENDIERFADRYGRQRLSQDERL